MSVVDLTGSTNADLARLALAGLAAPAALAARGQTGGRGRLNRAWSSPAGTSLSVSVLWRPGAPQSEWTWVPMLVGLAVVDAVAALGLPARLKWPNDVVVAAPAAPGVPPAPEAPAAAAPAASAVDGGAHAGLLKLAGVLVGVVPTPTGTAVVAGVGLNLTQDVADLPVSTATSLRLQLGEAAPGFDEVLDLLLATLAVRFRQWEDSPASLRRDYLAACTTIGRHVSVSGPAGTPPLRGRVFGLADDGALLLQDGPHRHVVAAGDVEHVR